MISLSVAKTGFQNISTHCTDNGTESCVTFKYWLSEVSKFFRNDYILQLKDGVHDVPEIASMPYLVENVTNLTFRGINGGSVVINCSRQASFVFINITNLNILNLSFLDCGFNITSQVLTTVDKHAKMPLSIEPEQQAGLFMVNINSLLFTGININNSLGYGIIGVNILGSSKINNCTISGSNSHIFNEVISQKDFTNCRNMVKCNGGNALFLYTDLVDKTNVEANLMITNTNISRGFNFFSPNKTQAEYNPNSNNFVEGGGLGLLLLQTHYKVNFVYRDSLLVHNVGFNGANVHIKLFNYIMNSKVVLDNLKLYFGNLNTFHWTRQYNPLKEPIISSGNGGGLCYEYAGDYLSTNSQESYNENSTSQPTLRQYDISFRNLHFNSNTALKGGGCYVNFHFSPNIKYNLSHNLLLENCTFVGNTGFYGAGLYINKLQYEQVFAQNTFPFNNSTVIKNTVFSKQEVPKFSELSEKVNGGIASAVFINEARGNLKMQNVSIMESIRCTGLLLINSAILCDGIKLLNNINHANGGGSILIEQSCFILVPNSQIIIANNSALAGTHHGGGIYIPSHQPYSYQKLCFFQILPQSKVSPKIKKIDDYNASIIFANNKAEEGYDIYGGDLENCFLLFWDIDSMEAYNSFVDTTNTTSKNDSKVTSHAQRLCFCFDNTYNCDIDTYTVPSAYPGQMFNVSAVPVGELNGVTSSQTIIATNFDKDHNFRLMRNGYKSLSKTCGNLTFAVKSRVSPKG